MLSNRVADARTAPCKNDSHCGKVAPFPRIRFPTAELRVLLREQIRERIRGDCWAYPCDDPRSNRHPASGTPGLGHRVNRLRKYRSDYLLARFDKHGRRETGILS